MNSREITAFRTYLKANNKNYCLGQLCEGKIHDISLFANKSTSNLCKKCKAKKANDYYHKNGRHSYQKTRNEIKNSSVCAQCEEDNPIFLEFDHNKNVKNVMIARITSTKKMLEESELTQILCVWCHRIKSYNNFNRATYSYDSDDELEKGDNSKQCMGPLCDGKYRSIDSFYVRKDRDGLYPICIKCIGEKAKISRMKKKQYIINEKLKIGKCQNEDCSRVVTKENYMCFDFDHLRDKIKSVSLFLSNSSSDLTPLQEEIEKCQLLCCYCHRLKTSKDHGWKYEENISKIKCRLCTNFVVGEEIYCDSCEPLEVSDICVLCNDNEKIKDKCLCSECYETVINYNKKTS